jgi:hypothetical protein
MSLLMLDSASLEEGSLEFTAASVAWSVMMPFGPAGCFVELFNDPTERRVGGNSGPAARVGSSASVDAEIND